MGQYLERAKELRATMQPHFNCAQSVEVPFAEKSGYTTDQARAFAACFGQGMHSGNLCGAYTGALMALGVLGIDSRANIHELTRRMRDNHEGTLMCADLLRKNAEEGKERKPHCDGMVYEAVAIVEELLAREV